MRVRGWLGSPSPCKAMQCKADSSRWEFQRRIQSSQKPPLQQAEEGAWHIQTKNNQTVSHKEKLLEPLPILKRGWWYILTLNQTNYLIQWETIGTPIIDSINQGLKSRAPECWFFIFWCHLLWTENDCEKYIFCCNLSSPESGESLGGALLDDISKVHPIFLLILASGSVSISTSIRWIKSKRIWNQIFLTKNRQNKWQKSITNLKHICKIFLSWFLLT